uniref:Uncharacterized protein n=1 Tax=Vespula pensylvanica TaxID=30213 RepID=A0A834PCG5_VESPE|nr:hypothetical protein H0235_003599 [Vespula pensylvanica]
MRNISWTTIVHVIRDIVPSQDDVALANVNWSDEMEQECEKDSNSSSSDSSTVVIVVVVLVGSSDGSDGSSGSNSSNKSRLLSKPD